MNHASRRLSTQLCRLSAPAAPAPITLAAPSPWRPIPWRLAAVETRTRPFTGTAIWRKKDLDEPERKAKELNQKGLDDHEKDVKLRQHQVKRPWLRENADKPPADQPAQNNPMAKGKLLTTPTRLLKLILPLPLAIEKDKDNNSKEYGRSISVNDDIQPLALLIHPQQPLSYVERLIQAELPPVLEDGREKIPNIYFRAEDTTTDRAKEKKGPSSPHVASYSGLGHEAEEDRKDSEKNWVRWSSSTEMGDFIRDAARGREFAIEVEGYHLEMRVGVPSFSDRTYYMRLRLRRMSKEIEELSRIKTECDLLAHKSAHTLAKGGFAMLSAWWGIVYYVTFHTEFGWDLVEPITYLAGLTTIMGGYLWFLYISRDLSYKAAMNITVSRRQNALYESRGFDLHKWENLVQEANALRKEVKTVASEYDVDWDETKDLGGEEVKEVLDKEKKKNGRHEDDEEEAEEEERSKTEKDKEKEEEEQKSKEEKKESE